jgi:serine/threonine protein kinase
MTIEHTQRQSAEDAHRARELSLAGTRPPAEVPGYDAERLLGRGAYGEVWIAVDRNTGRRVAIKFYLHRSGVDWSLLSREVEKLVYLSADRYVVQLLKVGWDSEPPYYVMEYVENGSLEAHLAQQVTLEVREAEELFRDLAVGLVHAHGKGVLHCDLKPANILLDQDNRPRLADFGQSRLSHEQSPALGTLFYMAPEQANLEAVPDARWDVYALGAIFYRMVTGDPPHRSEAALQRIERAGELPQRLAEYRSVLRKSPPPTSHRRVRGMDRSLAEIIDRCLAVDPERRFANVQEVLDALYARDARRHRRLLLLAGFIGPVLLLLVMTLFGLRGYEHAVRDSERIVSDRARDSNEFAAKFAARSIEGEIARYFRVVSQEAAATELVSRLVAVADSDVTNEINDPRLTTDDVVNLRPGFIDDPVRIELSRYLENRLQLYLDRLELDPRELKFASVLALDAKGRMLAVAYDKDVDTLSVGWNYAKRSYFHGGPADLDLPKEVAPKSPKTITRTHLSTAFLSTSTGTWKIAVSTPIFRSNAPGAEICGVLAVTINLGDFAYFRSNKGTDRFAVLIDGRPGPNFGVILQHPLLDQLNKDRPARKDLGGGPIEEPIELDHAAARERFGTTRYRVTQEQMSRLQDDRTYRFLDPLAQAPGGQWYAGEWIAAMDWVRLPDDSDVDPEMIVLVQERLAGATAPVKLLGGRLKREGLWAMGGVIGVICVLWYIVIRILGETPPARKPG